MRSAKRLMLNGLRQRLQWQKRLRRQKRNRRRMARWTVELAQDLVCIHGIDAEDELTRILTEAILGEVTNAS